MRRIGVVILLLVLAVPASASAGDDISVFDSTKQYKVEPRTIDFYGMPGPWLYRNLEWRSWGDIQAKSRMARLRVEDCKPSCAEGGLRPIRARLTLSKPGSCDGRRVYKKAILDPKKGGFAPVGTDIKPVPTLALEITCEGFVLPW